MIVGESVNMAKDATGATKEVIEAYVQAIDPAKGGEFAESAVLEEASKDMPMIREFKPFGLTHAQEEVDRLQKDSDSRDKKAIESALASAITAEMIAQQAVTDALPQDKDAKIKVLTEAQTKLAAAKKAKEDLEQLELQLSEAKRHLAEQKTSTEAVRRVPPTGEALAQYTTELTNGAIAEISAKHQGEVNRLTAKRNEAVALKQAISDPAERERLDADISRLQAQIRAEEEELNKLKLMTDHPEIFADFFRQMQNGEIPKDDVEKVQKALEAGDGSQLLKDEFMGEILKEKMEALKNRLAGSNNEKMKSLFEKYKPFLVTGGLAVFVLYQIIIQAMDKEDGGKR
jgi:hypothetical protein